MTICPDAQLSHWLARRWNLSLKPSTVPLQIPARTEYDSYDLHGLRRNLLTTDSAAERLSGQQWDLLRTKGCQRRQYAKPVLHVASAYVMSDTIFSYVYTP